MKSHPDISSRLKKKHAISSENCAAEKNEFQKEISHDNGPAKGTKSQNEISNCAVN
jgi:hypothetical protein